MGRFASNERSSRATLTMGHGSPLPDRKTTKSTLGEETTNAAQAGAFCFHDAGRTSFSIAVNFLLRLGTATLRLGNNIFGRKPSVNGRNE
jgi:hypothetical protein